MSAEEQGVSAKLGQERHPWHCPELHQMIVSAALDGAHAMAAFQDGFMSSVRPMGPQNTFSYALVSRCIGPTKGTCRAEQ